MVNFPDTYERLVEAGIGQDYSMGYASVPGFRAGTCKSFLFYNLAREEETSLRIIPFQVMDRTLKDYLGLSPQDSMAVIRELVDAVRTVNGIFSTIWHNDAFSDTGEWKGWAGLYREMLAYIQNL
jgi:hypothetical protein